MTTGALELLLSAFNGDTGQAWKAEPQGLFAFHRQGAHQCS